MPRTGRPPVEMTGQRFGRLVVLRRDGSLRERAAWLCRCDCGAVKTLAGSHLRKGGTVSCGCFRREGSAARSASWIAAGNAATRRHGMSGSPSWNSWKCMRDRCANPKAKDWPRYGGRGICVCARWQGRDGFVNFLADMGTRPAGMTLDRIDNDGNYEPSNCRWATPKQQRANQSS